jgi:hypothetical protein
LAETIETLAEAKRQALAVALILAASLAPAALGIQWAQTAALSAVAMSCVLAATTVGLRRRRRRQAFNLILEGREELPVDSWPVGSVFPRAAVAAVADQLGDVAALLRAEPSTARGVALATTLLTDGARSPLLRDDPRPLREELRRIRYLLASKSR